MNDNPQDWKWLDEIIESLRSRDGFDIFDGMFPEEAKAAIQQRFTAQAKQHQTELLKAQLDLLDNLDAHSYLEVTPPGQNALRGQVVRIAVLNTARLLLEKQLAEITKLEGEA